MPSPSTGTVTFLFTDIEGSTKLWEHYPEAMKSALARHDSILRRAIEANQGRLVKTTGDGWHAVFDSAVSGVAGALAAQQELQAEAWPEIKPDGVRVRMAVHTGEAEARDGDYFGPVLNRVARLMSTGYGGQILLSAATAELVRDYLPEGGVLLDLGDHRLKDLIRPEHVFQLNHVSLPTDFPPLRSLDMLPNNLPVQLSSFVGREREISDIKSLLGNNRLLTLVGSGGAGKTRLSLQVAADLLDSFPDGVWLVELAPITDPALVPEAVAAALDLHPPADRPLMSALTDYLRDKHLLLILDNCEHLITASARLADTVLRSCPHLKILASSREALGVTGETAWRIPSLTLPDVETGHMPDNLMRCEAVRLFVDRATAANPTFAVTSENAPAVAQICQRLDGIPLAIELATTRLKGLSVEQIATRLDDRFRLLTGGSRTALPRHQTLRTLIDWSYDLLSEPERMLLRRLAVFVGGWTMEAAEGVCAGDGLDAMDVFDLLLQLVNKSLVVVDERGAETRYRMLETIRQYARDRLLDSGEGEAARDRHFDWFLELTRRTTVNQRNAGWSERVVRLDFDHDNLRAALEWGLSRNAFAGLELVGNLQWFWRQQGHFEEWALWFKTALQKAEEETLRSENVPPGFAKLRVKGLFGLGSLYFSTGSVEASFAPLKEAEAGARELNNPQLLADILAILYSSYSLNGQHDIARTYSEEAFALYQAMDDELGSAALMFALAAGAVSRGDLKWAQASLEHVLTVGRAFGSRWHIMFSLMNLSRIAVKNQDFATAHAQLDECLSIGRALRDRALLGMVLSRQAELAEGEQDYARAEVNYMELLPRWEKVGNRGAMAAVMQYLGHIAVMQHDDAKARGWLEKSLAIRRELGDAREIGGPLEGLASLAEAQHQLERAACLLGAADILRGPTGKTLETYNRAEVERIAVSARAALGDAAFEASWAAGQAMTVEQAIAYGLET